MSRFRFPALAVSAVAALLCPCVAQAAPLAVEVRGADGATLAGAVVSIESARFRAPAPGGAFIMEQRDIAFAPHVLVVPVGATVGFPNRDRVRHHVYSFSKPKRFDLKLYGQDDTRKVTFDKAGAVALGCNIHDRMNGVVYVVDTPYAAQVDGAGRVRFANVPPGAVTIRVWHPSIRSPGNSLTRDQMLAAGGLATTVSIAR
ncbi:MAG TPA: methylamine utilization protein [Sphingomonas sp.]|jgi:plastocyanin|nr:methylamine utilization protein [Sphingomonas sp.]